MACFRPLYGWQKSEGGALKFGAEPPNTRRVDIPCGYCLGCRLARSRAWAVRCMHESQMHERNCFVTLTYDEEHYTPSLNYSDFKRFIRRVVAAKGPTRYFMCGEYGDKNKRPHFHAILFGQDFDDVQDLGRTNTSEELATLWGKGFASVDEATFRSAGYVARYTVKKVFGSRQAEHYKRVNLRTGEVISVSPEFAQMSRRPGIGQSFLEKFWPEIYAARDGVVLAAGKTIKPPRYYDDWIKLTEPFLKEEKDYERLINSRRFAADCTPERLVARELVAMENLKRQRREL